MGKKKHRSGGLGATIRKWSRVIVSAAGKVIGGTVILSPVIEERDKLTSGDLSGFADGVTYRYTGYTPSTQAFDGGQLAKGIGTIIAGIAIIKLFSIAARHF